MPRRVRSTRIGIEHELLAFDTTTGDAVAIERVRRAVAGTPLQGAVAFEPGGQVELNQPCAPGPTSLHRAFLAGVGELRGRCAGAGVRLEAEPMDRRPLAALPLQLRSPRYLAMQAHFDRIGPAGRRMMRQTAGTQVCLDWWPGAAGAEQWRVLLLAGPFLAAALSRSAGPDSRLATWLAVDPDRTGFDDRLLRGADPVAAYADLARRATRFVSPAEHLSTLFPPVRPRGHYLEIRFLDVQPDEAVPAIATSLAGLVYDADRRRDALALLAPEQPRLAELWQTAALTPDRIADVGHALLGTSLLAGAA